MSDLPVDSSPSPAIRSREAVTAVAGCGDDDLAVQDAENRCSMTGGVRWPLGPSRDPEYLAAIEKVLRERVRLRHTRVLLGSPRRQELKDHLLHVLDLRDPAARDQGYQTLYLALFDDSRRQVEFNLCGNERRCLVVLPSADGGIGEYDTAVVFSDPEVVHGYRSLAQALAKAGTSLDRKDQIEALTVLG